ncbi:MAG: S8/S53 family peptidase [bacterium]
MRRFALISILLGWCAVNAAVNDPIDLKLSPPLRFLLAVREAPPETLPTMLRSVVAAEEISVSIRFVAGIEPAEWEGRGLRFQKVLGQYAGSGTIYGAVMAWDEVRRWAQEAEIAMISSDWRPCVYPCLDVSAPEVGASEVWGFPITGDGQMVADFDTGVDIFHPTLFRAATAYNWIDVNQDSAFTPDVDAVDLNGNGINEWNETLNFFDGEIYDPAMTFGGTGISNGDGVYQADWDWLYNDSIHNQMRDYGPGPSFTEADPGYGEKLFYCVDANENNELDPGETLLLLDASKVRAVMQPGGMVRRRGVDLINAMPDQNGHGTAVSGVLVGGEPGISRFCGLAPGADLLMGYFFSGVSFTQYLPWVRNEGCRVLLYEFGGFVFNPLDGSTNEELLLDSEAGQGVMQVTPSGNLNRGYKHCQLQLASGASVPVQMEVAEFEGSEPTSWFGSFLWREPTIEISFQLQEPNGASIFLEGIGGTQPLGDWTVYSGFWVSPRGTAEYDISVFDGGGQPALGIWTLTLSHPGGVGFEVNGNVADDVTAWGGGAEFLDYRSNDKTVTWPATADSAFVLGSYSTRGYEQYVGVGSGSIQPGEISLFSGRGTRIDGMHILSIASPGNYDIYTIRSEYGLPFSHGGYRQFSGTSAAGPHVAASAALVMEAEPSLTRLEVETILEDYALKDSCTGSSYNDTWGHGKLRVNELIATLAVAPENPKATLPQTLEISAYPNPANPTVAIELQLTRQQEITVAIYDLLGREVDQIYHGMAGPGTYHLTWRAGEFSSGVYLLALEAEGQRLARKVVVLK